MASTSLALAAGAPLVSGSEPRDRNSPLAETLSRNSKGFLPGSVAPHGRPAEALRHREDRPPRVCGEPGSSLRADRSQGMLWLPSKLRTCAGDVYGVVIIARWDSQAAFAYP